MLGQLLFAVLPKESKLQGGSSYFMCFVDLLLRQNKNDPRIARNTRRNMKRVELDF